MIFIHLLQDEYVLEVVATDDNPTNTLRSATNTLTITVTDVNDVTPYFTPNYYVTSIAETAAQNDAVVTVTANDDDSAGNYATIVFSIDSGQSGNEFQIDPSTGNIYVFTGHK